MALIDARQLTDGTTIDADICIVGGGAAGITLARELRNKSYRICILESGGLEADEKSQSLSYGKNVGLPYDQVAENKAQDRYLGGNTNRWASYCRPLDELDFEVRDWVPHSGWPFSKQELDPYYERAQVVCKVDRYDYSTEYLSSKVDDADFRPLDLPGNEIVTKMWQFHSPPVRFGEDFRTDLEQANDIDVYLNANVIDIELNDAQKSVSRLKIACIDGPQLWATGKVFVLAMNGIETPRLMLAANTQQPAGIGNQNDLVGRFFMEHPHFHRCGLMLIPDLNNYPTLYSHEAKRRHGTLAAFCPSEELQIREEILNYSATVDPSTRFWPNMRVSDGFTSNLVAVAKDLGGLSERVMVRLGRKAEAEMERSALLDVRTRMEQAPNPNSRITLSSEKDLLGVNRYEMNWQLTNLDKKTILKTQEAIAKALGSAGLGRMRIDITEALEDDLMAAWDPRGDISGAYFDGGWHHMGTTRMHVDPKQGVVDENSKVHGLANLYIAGSSVFPTGGYANPMLSLLALTIRLADYLDTQVSIA